MEDGFPAKVAKFMAANPPPPCEVWDCNWPAYLVFRSMVTQWRSGFGGPTGLDYTALKTVMEIHGIADQQQMLDDIATMEFEALKVFKERKNG